ncbi:hypothetical protein CEUSTIGMA_g1945.t1 [Chlamydomonas eustigma]|uniref:Flagellar associated protein n=1 Tax=Chlamydomonas eustigma TaxID=1157962 RepID=A0A250WUQ3_9CHLO|nr:hypothetical protein CEUSTIGMA_g1945.t1 [Chlamydomonas eustigma]|eukprot:GAX74496.1 hypothetical protein CEUSTIGMA_g1945.t1 [Chlamydomonas eustigma]
MAVEDPACRMLRSGFSKQPKSINVTEPAYGFGTAARDNFSKLYLSPEQAKAQAGNVSQGAVYKVYQGIGTQPDSKFPTAASTGFGTSSRSIKYGANNFPGPGTYSQEGGIGLMRESRHETSARTVFGSSTRDAAAKVFLDEELMKVNYGRTSPGPCTYTQPSGHGKQTDSKYTTYPAYKLGTSKRFAEKNTWKDVPGAGSYANNYPSVGKQTLSTKQTGPTPMIGTSQRDVCTKKVFISKEHEKAAFGEISPGPAIAPIIPSFGSQTISTKKTNPTWGFGTSKRSPGYDNGTPGPGRKSRKYRKVVA